MKNIYWLLYYLILASFFSCSSPKYRDALTPEEALRNFQLAEGFEIRIFAAEPYVYDPVEMVFDERGDIYVVEMPDYPYKPKPGEAKGRIRKIMDTDGDGRVDKASIFADSLSEATSILPWKGGMLVTTAPYILYLKDTDQDGVADEEEILFSGFFENNSEAQITNLRFSVDNWIYAANFGQAGEVRFHRTPDAPPLQMKGGDFRFRLDRGEFELAGGPTQFGQAINDWGHRFMSQNTLHLRHAVIPWRYLHRHTYLPSTQALYNVSDHDLEMFQQTPPPYWRAVRTNRRQQRYEEQGLDRIEYAEDHFTGASGATFYGGDLFPEEYYGNIFIGDVAGNLVHRDILTPLKDSPTFVAQRAASERDREFLTSTDPWFRPANFVVGPNGALFVLDYYRQHIETPLSIPEDLKAEMDFYNGSQHGRIYRISPTQPSASNIHPLKLDAFTSEELAELLAHPNRWHRLQAQRLLLERQDLSIEDRIQSLFFLHEDPRTRLHALYVLEGLDLLDVKLVEHALQDPHPGVREQAIILAERYVELLPKIQASINDPDIRVAFQASLSVGAYDGERVIASLAESIRRYGEDPWFRLAVLSSQAGASMDMMETLQEEGFFEGNPDPHKIALLKDFVELVKKRNQKAEIEQLLKWVGELEEEWQKQEELKQILAEIREVVAG